ncbi:hypothetical protein ABZ702_26035 [Streptomyces cyaneofuscatus]|uniref:hypothetical protein n=1 Tax=Streptomyces cyaneofuscatus TaxID=66883 RepID=UPI0033F937B0
MTVGITHNTFVSIFLADFANADPAGKVNVIGAGWHVVAMSDIGGGTAPHALVVLISVAPPADDVELSTRLTLRDSGGDVVAVPGAGGKPQFLDLPQVVKVGIPKADESVAAADLWGQGKIIVNLPGGLPLNPGEQYEWVFEIDGVGGTRWAAPFLVLQPSQLATVDDAGHPTYTQGDIGV